MLGATLAPHRTVPDAYVASIAETLAKTGGPLRYRGARAGRPTPIVPPCPGRPERRGVSARAAADPTAFSVGPCSRWRLGTGSPVGHVIFAASRCRTDREGRRVWWCDRGASASLGSCSVRRRVWPTVLPRYNIVVATSRGSALRLDRGRRSDRHIAAVIAGRYRHVPHESITMVGCRPRRGGAQLWPGAAGGGQPVSRWPPPTASPGAAALLWAGSQGLSACTREPTSFLDPPPSPCTSCVTRLATGRGFSNQEISGRDVPHGTQRACWGVRPGVRRGGPARARLVLASGRVRRGAW